MQVFHGIAVSPGLTEGEALRVDKGDVAIPKYWLHDKEIESEVTRFEEALQSTYAQIDHLREKLSYLSNREHLLILEAHMAMLKDPILRDKTIQLVREEKINSEWALQKTQKNLLEAFSRIDQEYLRERQNDINHVVVRIQDELQGKSSPFPRITKEVIVVAHDLSPIDLAHLPRDLIKGFAIDVGGRTSHTGIIAASMEIPAVVGVSRLFQQTHSGDRIIIDGMHGLVLLNPTAETTREYQKKKKEYARTLKVLSAERTLPSETKDHRTLHLLANVELKEEIPFVRKQGAQGIGLFRTEFLLLESHRPPTEEHQTYDYISILKEIAPLPVTVRTYDLGGEKGLPHLRTTLNEPNPALGLRAIRFCLKTPDVFRTQLRALLRASPYGNLRIMFPLISSLEEYLQAKEFTQKILHDLQRENIPVNEKIPIGVMLETPAAVLMARELARVCDFFSVGTNDLIQYTLAVDRVNENVAYLYNPLHPAILRMLRHVTSVAQKQGIPANLCGEMASDPVYVPILVALGFHELSLNAAVLPRVKHLLRSMTIEECNKIYRRVIKSSHESSSLQLLHRIMAKRFPEYFENEP